MVLLLVEMVPLLVPPPVNIRVPCVRSTVPLLVKLAAMVVVPLVPERVKVPALVKLAELLP